MKSYKEFKEGFAHPNHKKLDANNNGKLDADDFKLLRKKKQSTKEDCSMKEDLEEMDLSFIKGSKPRGSVADQKAARDALIAKRKETNPNPPQLGSSSSDKYKLGDYDKKSNRSYSEEVEQIDELSKKTLGSYVKKATSDVGLAGFVKGTTVNDHSRSKDYDDAATMNKKRKVGIAKAVDKLTKESIELDEKLDPSMSAGKYIKDFKKSDAPQFKGKSPEKRRIMGVAAFLDAQRKIKEEVELKEARKEPAQVYHPTYSSAVQHARANAEKQGYTVSDDDWFHHVNSGPGKPSGGKTTRHVIPLQKDGKPSKKALAIQVHDRQTDKNSYELNSYIN
jgi:hypothetical protein